MRIPEERPPTIETSTTPFWLPWDPTNGQGSKVEVKPLPPIPELVETLPEEYAAFQIGTLLVVTCTIHEGIFDSPSKQEFSSLHPKLFVVESRTEQIDLAEVEKRTPQLVAHMLESGMTTALDFGDGKVLANNPSIVQLV